MWPPVTPDATQPREQRVYAVYRGLHVIALAPLLNEEQKIGEVVRRMPREVVGTFFTWTALRRFVAAPGAGVDRVFLAGIGRRVLRRRLGPLRVLALSRHGVGRGAAAVSSKLAIAVNHLVGRGHTARCQHRNEQEGRNDTGVPGF
jgi:hypothetical protein